MTNNYFIELGIDLNKLLDYFQAQKISEKGETLRCLCLFHEERTPSFFFSLDRGLYYCFGCDASGDIIDLVKNKMKMNYRDATDWLMKFYGITGDSSSFSHAIRHFSESNKFIQNIQDMKDLFAEHQRYEESFIEKLDKTHREFYYEKGFNDEILNEFEVGYALDGHSVGRLFFPVRDEQGYLIGVSGRRIDGDDGMFKWIHSTSLAKKNVLYNLQNARKYVIIDSNRELIIVEGPVDCMRAASYGKRNTVALLGHRVSDVQRHLMMRCALTITLALDEDEAGRQGMQDAIKKLWGSFELYKMKLPEGKDIGDLTEEEFITAYYGKELVTKSLLKRA